MTYVGGIGGNIGQGALSGDRDDVLLELGRGELINSEGRVLGRLERDEVGQETSDVGRGHRGTGNGVDGVLAANPGGEDVETRSKDVSALSVVGEVGTLVLKRRGGNSHGVLRGSRRVVAGVSIVIASGNGEVQTSLDTSVDGILKSLRLATTKTHVRNATLEALLALLGPLEMGLNSPFDTLNDIGHGARPAGSQDLDSKEVGLLGDTVLLTGDGSRAVSAVAVTIGILIVVRDGLAPSGPALEVNVLNVDTSVNGVSIDTLTALRRIQVFVERAKGERVTVRDTGQTPGGVLLNLALLTHGEDFGVLLDVLDLQRDQPTSPRQEDEGAEEPRGTRSGTYVGMSSDLLDNILMEVTRVAHQGAGNVKSVLETEVELVPDAKERPLLQVNPLNLRLVDVLHPAVMSRHRFGIDMLLEDDDVGVGDLLRVARRQDRGSIVVDGVDGNGRGRRQQRQQRKAEEAFHDGQV